jgi:hypothetical protein
MKCRHCGRATSAPERQVDEPACRDVCMEVRRTAGAEASTSVARMARLLFEFGLAAGAPPLFGTRVETFQA